MTHGSEVEVTFEIPVTLALEFLRGSGFLSVGMGFTALNYSHSIVLGKNRGQKRSHRQGLFL